MKEVPIVRTGETMTGAELLTEMLAAYGVDPVFGLPGDTNAAFYDAIARKNSLQHVLTRDERGAGYMADAFARVSNRPAVVEVPSGGGPMYALPAIAEAHGSSVPVILITCDTPLAHEGRGFIAEFDAVRMFEPITKLSVKIKTAALIPEIVRRAFRIATSGKPGAVHLAIPEDVFHQEVDVASISLHSEPACTRYPAYPAHAGYEDLVALDLLLQTARRPLIVAGGGVGRSDAADSLQAVAERYRVPVVTTITGQNSMPDRHELAIGNIGDNGFHPHAVRAMQEADLLLFVGCRVGSTMSHAWTLPAKREQRQSVAHIDISPEALGNNYVTRLAIAADAESALAALLRLPASEPAGRDAHWIGTLNRWRAAFWKDADERIVGIEADEGAAVISPHFLVEQLRRRLTGPATIIADPGTPTPYLCRYLRRDRSDIELIFQRAFGSLGYALPAIVGAWFADKRRRPIGMFGDGSLGMSIGDLETIARLEVPAILMNFNNSSFGYIKALQQAYGYPRPMSVDFSNLDCAAMARSFGLEAYRVDTNSALPSALDAAFASKSPVFLDLVVPTAAELVPPMFGWLRKSGIDPLLVGGEPLLYSPLEQVR